MIGTENQFLKLLRCPFTWEVWYSVLRVWHALGYLGRFSQVCCLLRGQKLLEENDLEVGPCCDLMVHLAGKESKCLKAKQRLLSRCTRQLKEKVVFGASLCKGCELLRPGELDSNWNQFWVVILYRKLVVLWGFFGEIAWRLAF